jgi:hypothetical protein
LLLITCGSGWLYCQEPVQALKLETALRRSIGHPVAPTEKLVKSGRQTDKYCSSKSQTLPRGCHNGFLSARGPLGATRSGWQSMPKHLTPLAS